MIDSHCHLNFHSFSESHVEVVARAKAAGVEAIVCPSTYPGSSERAIELAALYPDWLFPAVGHHPTHVVKHPFDIATYHQLASHPTVVAIGEVGLDAHREEARQTFAQQKTILTAQLDLAHRLQKPVILHSRDAYDELVALVDVLSYRPRGVIHCFEGTWQQAQQFLDRDFMIGFTGIVTYPGNDSLRDVVRQIPLERLLVETDAPFLAPQAFRGQSNEPAFVAETVARIAEYRGQPVSEVARVTADNTRSLFGLPQGGVDARVERAK